MTTFPEKRIITHGACDLIEAAGQYPQIFLDRHEEGDWGDVTDEEKRANDEAMISGGRLCSAYHTLKGDKICIVTSANRTSTTIMLPDEDEEEVQREGVPDSFWVVLIPTPDSQLEDICFECDHEQFAARLHSGMEMDMVVGFYGNKETAQPVAARLLKTVQQAAKGDPK